MVASQEPGNGTAAAGGDEAGMDASEFLAHVEANLHPSVNTILVVDDDPPMRKLVARLVSSSSPTVNVVQAINGRDALVKLEELREKSRRDPLFIVTDLEMPVMDGWTLISKLKKDYKSRGESQGIPVIVLSSTGGEKSGVLSRKSVHKASFYSPLVAVAKEECIDPERYAAVGEQGLLTWVEYFLKYD